MPICKHLKYKHVVKFAVVKMAEFGTFQPILRMQATCTECGDPYTFRAPNGFSTIHPTTNYDSTELRIPIDYPTTSEDEGDILQ